MATLASLVIKILGDTSSLEAAVDKASRKVGDLGGAVKRNLPAIGALGAAGIAAGIGSAVSAAANFEQQIDAVGAVAGATNKEMAGLSKTALRIGKDTAFSATEAAQAMEELAASGISVKDIMNGAADATVTLAAAGGTDLTTAAKTAADAMNIWSLKTSDMKDVVNRLAGAANVSKYGVEDMSQALAMGGGVAASAGVEFADFATSIAAIASSFSSGSDAGTSFKQFLNGLTPNSKTATKAMEQLGIITKEAGNRFFDSKGNLKSMADVSQILYDATKDLSEAQKAQALETIFGSDAMRAAAAIAQITGDHFRDLHNKMGETDALKVAKDRMDNAKGAMEQLNGAIEVIQISIGTKFLPVVKAVANTLAEHPALITALAGVIGGVMVAALVAWTAATLVAVKANVALAASEYAALGPWLLIAAAVAAATLAIIYAIKHWDEIKAAVKSATDFILGYLRKNWPEVAVLISGPFAPLVLLATDAFGVRSALVEALGKVIETAARIPVEVSAAVGSLKRLLYEEGKGIIDGLWQGMKDAWGGPEKWLSQLGGWIKNLKGPPAQDAVLLVDNGKLIMRGFAEGLTSGFDQYVMPKLKKVSSDLMKLLNSAKFQFANGMPTFGLQEDEAYDVWRVFNGLNPVGATHQAMTSAQARGWLKSAGVPGYVSGTNFVPETGLALLHRGEAVVTAQENRRRRSADGSIEVTINGPMTINNAPGETDTLQTLNNLAYAFRGALRRSGYPAVS